jgi:hypothetical protein
MGRQVKELIHSNFVLETPDLIDKIVHSRHGGVPD